MNPLIAFRIFRRKCLITRPVAPPNNWACVRNWAARFLTARPVTLLHLTRRFEDADAMIAMTPVPDRTSASNAIDSLAPHRESNLHNMSKTSIAFVAVRAAAHTNSWSDSCSFEGGIGGAVSGIYFQKSSGVIHAIP